MRVCIDTSILIDILKDEFRPFQEKLYEAMEKNESLVAPSVVYGELMPQFKGNEKEAADFLADHKIELEPLDTVGDPERNTPVNHESSGRNEAKLLSL